MKKFLKILQIILTVLSAACLIPVFVLLACSLNIPAFICVGVALVLFLSVAVLKVVRDKLETKTNPPVPQGDFFNPLPKNDATKQTADDDTVTDE